ncbi:MAG: DUF5666 domain-containing protein [Deinococcales bacterium]
MPRYLHVILKLSLLIILAACTLNPPQETLVSFDLSIKGWSSDTSVAQQSQEKVEVELYDQAAQLVHFSENLAQASQGKSRLALSAQVPSLTLKLKPATYVIKFYPQSRSPKVQLQQVVVDGGLELNLSTLASINSIAPSPAPPISVDDRMARNFLIAYGQVSEFDPSSQSFKLKDLPSISFSSDVNSQFYDEALGGPISAEVFWQGLSQDKALGVEGYYQDGKVIAYYIFSLNGDKGTFSYLALSGLIQLKQDEFGLSGIDLKINVSNDTFYYNEYEVLSAEVFRARLQDGRYLFLDGSLDSSGFQVQSAMLPAQGDEIPPQPFYIDGTIEDFDASSLQISLSGWQFKLNAETLIYDDSRGEVRAEDFWQDLAVGQYLSVELLPETDNSYVAHYIFWLKEPPPPPITSVQGSVNSIDLAARRLGLEGFMGFSLEVHDASLYYASDGTELSADSFWQGLQEGDYLIAEGYYQEPVVSSDQTEKTILFRADRIYKLPEAPLTVLSGQVMTVDREAKHLTMALDSIVTPMQTEPSPGGTEPSSNLEVDVSEDVRYGDVNGELSAEDFWQGVEVGEWLELQGHYQADGSFLASSLFKIEVRYTTHYEGSVNTFASAEQIISLNEWPEFIFQAQESTSYYLNQGDTITQLEAADFWQSLALGDYLSLKIENSGAISRSPNILSLVKFSGSPNPRPVASP